MNFERNKGVIKGLDVGKDRSTIFKIIPLSEPTGAIYYLDYVYGGQSITDSKLKSTLFEGTVSVDIESSSNITIIQKK